MRRMLFSLLSVCLLVGCETKTFSDEDIAAYVGDVPIYWSDVIQRKEVRQEFYEITVENIKTVGAPMEETVDYLLGRKAQVKDFNEEMLEEIIRQEVVKQAAQQQGVAADRDSVLELINYDELMAVEKEEEPFADTKVFYLDVKGYMEKHDLTKEGYIETVYKDYEYSSNYNGLKQRYIEEHELEEKDNQTKMDMFNDYVDQLVAEAEIARKG